MNGGAENEGEDHRAMIECLHEIKLTIEPIIKKIKSNQDSDGQPSKETSPIKTSNQEYDPKTGQYQNRNPFSTLNIKPMISNQGWGLNQDLDQDILSNAYHRQTQTQTQNQNQNQNNLAGSQLQSQNQFNGDLQSQSEFLSTYSQKEKESQLQNSNQPINSFFIHPLSFPTHQIKNSKIQLINSLKSIQHSIVKFHHSVLGPLISHVPPLPEPISDQPNITQTQFPKLFSLLRESSRGLNYLMNVKIESEIADQLINHHHSSISSLSPQFIINQSHSFNSSQSQTLHLIELLLRQHSLEFFREPDSNLLMIAGKVMVIDLELDSPTQIEPNLQPNLNQTSKLNQVLTNQKVIRCKFSYSFGDEESKRDEELDKALLNSLKNIHQIHQPKLILESLKQFSNLLLQLKSIDELISSQPTQTQQSGVEPIDYFVQFRLLIKSFHLKFWEFLKFDCHDSTSLQSFIDLDIPPIDSENLSPYGYPISSSNHFELKIIYHLNPAKLIRFKSQPHEILRNSNHLMIIKFTKPNKLNKYSIDSLFTVVFDPPILVSKSIALELNQITNPIHQKKGKTKIIESDENDLFLDDLLLINQLEKESKENIEKEVEKVKEIKLKLNLKKIELLKEGKWRDDQFGFGLIPLMKFSCIKRDEDLEIKNHLGFLIQEVGFNDLNGLLKIIHISRKQSILNELFQSCFNSRHYLFSNKDKKEQENRNLFINKEEEEVVEEEEGLLKEEITLDELLSNQKPKSIPIEIILNSNLFELILQFPSPILPSYQNRLPISIKLKIQEDFKIKLKISTFKEEEEKEKEKEEDLSKIKLNKLERLIDRIQNLPIFLDYFIKELIKEQKHENDQDQDQDQGEEMQLEIGNGTRKRLIGSLSSNNDDDDRQQEKRKKVENEIGNGDGDTDMNQVNEEEEESNVKKDEMVDLTMINEQVMVVEKVEDMAQDITVEKEEKDEKMNEIGKEEKDEKINEKKEQIEIQIEDGIGNGKQNKREREDEEKNEGSEEKVEEMVGLEGKVGEKVEEKVEEKVKEKVGEKVEEKVVEDIGEKVGDKDEEKVGDKDEEKEKDEEEKTEEDKDKDKDKERDEEKEKVEEKEKEKDHEIEIGNGDDGIRRSKRTKR